MSYIHQSYRETTSPNVVPRDISFLDEGVISTHLSLLIDTHWLIWID